MMRTSCGIGAFTLAVCAALAYEVEGESWPNFHGPRHDGHSLETGWIDVWPESGPLVLWRASVGIGFSSMAVSEGAALTLGNKDGKDTVWCFDALSGNVRWTHTYPSDPDPKFYEGGPGSTPTIIGDRVYTMSKWGDLFCFQISSGEILWQRALAKEEGLSVPDWGFSGSPLGFENLLILNLGGGGMAVHQVTGATVWKSDQTEAGYSTPLPFEFEGKPCVLVSSAEAYSAVIAQTGKRLWSIPWLTRYGVNAANPIVQSNRVFVASGYQKGSALYELIDGQPELVWKNKALRAQQNGPVLIDGFLYGFDGDSNSRAKLKCVRWETGETQWENESLGYGSLFSSGSYLMALGAKGVLAVAPASPRGFEPICSAKVLDGKCWTLPVLSGGLIYCRNATGDLVCLDTRTPPASQP